MLLAIITDSKNQTSSQPIFADSLELLNHSLKKLNPENLSDLTVTPILYFDSISQLQNYYSTPLNIRSAEVTPSATQQPEGASSYPGYGFYDPNHPPTLPEKKIKRSMRKDYFTSALPWKKKHD